MKGKGVSTVIATLLMLLITIALAGVTYSYISGVFFGKTAVVLNVEGEPFCQPGGTTNAIVFWVRNDGTNNATGLAWANVPGNPSGITSCSFEPAPTTNVISAGNHSMVQCTRASAGTGYYQIRITSSGTGPLIVKVYCSS